MKLSSYNVIFSHFILFWQIYERELSYASIGLRSYFSYSLHCKQFNKLLHVTHTCSKKLLEVVRLEGSVTLIVKLVGKFNRNLFRSSPNSFVHYLGLIVQVQCSILFLISCSRVDVIIGIRAKTPLTCYHGWSRYSHARIRKKGRYFERFHGRNYEFLQ